MHRADGAGGAALIGAVALGLAWIFGAVALHAPGTTQLRADVQNSVILRELDHVLPPSGGVLNVLDRVDPAPSITGPATPIAAARPADRRRPARCCDAGDSVVRVLSTACGLGIEGSGWAVRPNLIVTNAHVVAGADDTTVTTQSGVELDATAVLLRARRRPGAAAGGSRAADPADGRGQPRRVGGGGPRLPRERSLHGDPGAGRRDARNDQRGLLRARADRPHDHGAGRRRAQRQLGRAAAEQGRQGGRGRLRGDDERAAAAGSRCRSTKCARRCTTSPTAPSTPAPARARWGGRALCRPRRPSEVGPGRLMAVLAGCDRDETPRTGGSAAFRRGSVRERPHLGRDR